MKIFNGRIATEDYMSSHSLTFSTPELTLKKFALWLGDQVDDPKTNVATPRLLLYIEDRKTLVSSGSTQKNLDFLPDVDETFKPTGAIADLYSESRDDVASTESMPNTGSDKKYCIHCGSTLKLSSKFCNKCGGIVQE